ncbi:hypothetical protein NOC27_1280 [Nitrosococcus oceani AFC27]|nr:hypothetical protein NOC27_1280 [Nitrosococcus oceani AFC27]
MGVHLEELLAIPLDLNIPSGVVGLGAFSEGAKPLGRGDDAPGP